MRRVIVVALAGASLAGCSSFSFDSLKPAPPMVQVQLESVPPGADAKTSAGPGCKTPCQVAVPAVDFTVSFTMNRFQPATVPVQVINVAGDYSGEFVTPGSITIEPNPVFAELRPAGPPPRAKSQRPKARKPPAAAPAASSPFPAPPPAR
jgi:hypothetical protein